MATPTLKVLEERVGDGGRNHTHSVRRLQALLFYCGYLSGNGSLFDADNHTYGYRNERAAVLADAAADGDWGKKSREALAKYLGKRTDASDVYLDPSDRRIHDLLWHSPCTIPVFPGKQGASAFLAAQHYFRESPITPFRYPEGMLVKGVEGCPILAIVTETYSSARPWFQPIPAVLNCSTYVNFMMSIWRMGDCHRAPYTPDVSDAGAASFPVTHYGYTRLNGGKPIDGAKSVLSTIEATGRDGLYCLQYAKATLGSPVGHMALLYKLRVYEANFENGPTGAQGGVQDSPLEEWMGDHGRAYVAGPSSP